MRNPFLFPIGAFAFFRFIFFNTWPLAFGSPDFYFFAQFLLFSRNKRKAYETKGVLVEADAGSAHEENFGASTSVSTPPRLPPMTKLEMLKACLPYFPIYFVASFLANTSFGLTDVLSASILLSTSCLFTLILSVLFRLESLSTMKVLSVAISVGGVLIVWLLAMNYDESIVKISGTKNFYVGNIYAIVSALLYGVYSVMLKKIAVDEDRVNMTFFFGLVGLLSMVILWPIFIILNFYQIEVFELPSWEIFGLLILNYLFGTLLPNFFWGIAVLYTSPLITSIGISLITPVSVVINVLWKGDSFFNYRLLASIFMIISFVMVNLTALYPKFNYFFEDNLCPTRFKRRRPLHRQVTQEMSLLDAFTTNESSMTFPPNELDANSLPTEDRTPMQALPISPTRHFPEKDLSYLTNTFISDLRD